MWMCVARLDGNIRQVAGHAEPSACANVCNVRMRTSAHTCKIDAMHMHMPCTRHVHAMHMPCTCLDAMHMLTCKIDAMRKQQKAR